MNEWSILKSELDILMIYEEEAEAVSQVMYKCNFPSEVERWVWVGDSLLKQGPQGQFAPEVQQIQPQQGQQGLTNLDELALQLNQQPQQQQQPQGVQQRMTPSLASRFKPWGTRTEVQGPGFETGPGTQQFHQANVKGGHGPQEYHDWVNEQYGEPQDGVGQRMGQALGRFGTWAGDKAKGAWGGAKNLGRKTARGFEGAGTYIDEMGGSMGRGLTGVWDAFGNARDKAGQAMSERAQIQGGHATEEQIQQERDRDRKEELQGQQKTLADEIAAIGIGGRHGTGAGAPRGVPQRPEIPPAPLLDNLEPPRLPPLPQSGPTLPPPEEQAPSGPSLPPQEQAPSGPSLPPQEEAPSGPSLPPQEEQALTTGPQAGQTGVAPVGFSETEWGNLGPGVQNAWGKVEPEAQQAIYDAMRRGEWDKDKGGTYGWKKGRWGSGRAAMEGLDQTAPTLPEDEGIQGPVDHGAFADRGFKDAPPAPPADYADIANRARKEEAARQKNASSDSFQHAWGYLLKGL